MTSDSYKIEWHDTQVGRVFAVDHGDGLKTAGEVGVMDRIEIITTLDGKRATKHCVSAHGYAMHGDDIIRDAIRQQIDALTKENRK